MILSLPFPPTGNHSVKHGGGHHYLTPQAKAYRSQVNALAQASGASPMDGTLQVVAEIYPPDRRRRDMDNIWKTLADSLTLAGVWQDDAQVVDLRLVRMAQREGGQVVVTIKEVSE